MRHFSLRRGLRLQLCVWLLLAPASVFANELIFPQMVSGGGAIRSILTFTNDNLLSAKGVIEFVSSRGFDMPVTIDGRTSSTFEIEIPPNGSVILSTDLGQTGQSIQGGWGVAKFDRFVSGIATFQIYAQGNLQSEVTVFPGARTKFATLPVDARNGQRTAFAIVDPQRSDCTGFVLMWADLIEATGNLRARSGIAVERCGRTAKFVEELFADSVPSNFVGKVIFKNREPSSEVVLLGLKQTGLILSGLPIGIPVVTEQSILAEISGRYLVTEEKRTSGGATEESSTWIMNVVDGKLTIDEITKDPVTKISFEKISLTGTLIRATRVRQINDADNPRIVRTDFQLEYFPAYLLGTFTGGGSAGTARGLKNP